MERTVLGLFDDLDTAQRAVADLLQEGFQNEDISFLARDRAGELAAEPLGRDVVEEAVAEGAGKGAVAGTVVGGAMGLLVGLGVLAIPGVGAVIAAGTLAATLGSTVVGAGVGAAAGGLAGGLANAGIHPTDMTYYTEAIRQGGVLVAVHAETDEEADRAQALVHRHGGTQRVEQRIAAETQRGEDLDKVPLTTVVPEPRNDT